MAGELGMAWKCPDGHETDYFHGDCFLGRKICQCDKEMHIANESYFESFRRWGYAETARYVRELGVRQLASVVRQMGLRCRMNKAAMVAAILNAIEAV